MNKQILYTVALIFTFSVLIQANDSTYAIKDCIISQIITMNNITIIPGIDNSEIALYSFPEVLKDTEKRKLCVRFDPSFSFRFKPALIFEIIGESDLSFDWKGIGNSHNSIPKVALVDAGVSLALNF